jgi:outer membrane receptor protein involved in Fe transport
MFARRSGAERFNVNQPPDDDVRSRTANLTGGINADWRWSTLAGNSLLAVRAGLDGSGNRVHARIFVVPHIMEDPADSLTTDVRSPGWNVAGYTIADMRMGRFTLSAGGRYDYVRIPFRDALDPAADTASTYWRFSPRGGISVDAGAGRSLYASVGQSFRAPAILELACADPDDSCPLPFALGDDPPLAPVRATTYELGGTWTRGGAGASASVYRTDVRDEILFVASDQARLSGYFTNLARTRREGAELSARFERPDGVVAGYASYTYTRASFQRAAELFSMRSDARFAASTLAGPNEVASGDRLPLLPDHLIKAGASVRLPAGADVGLDARYVGRQWLRGDEANETSRLDPYIVTNARVGVVRSAWDVALLATNLLDLRRATFGTFNENRRTGELERFLTPLSGRTVRVTVRRHFGADSMREPN